MGNIKAGLLLLLAALMGSTLTVWADTPLSQSATQFVQAFWGAWSGPNLTAVTYAEFAVTDPVNFYGKSISRDAYAKLQDGFTNRWPERQYTIVPGSEQINCNQAALSCDVSGIVSWRNFDPKRKVASTGAAKFDFSLRETTDQKGNLTGLAISAMTGSDITQALFQAPPDSAVVNAASASGNFHASKDGQQENIVSDAALQTAGCASDDDEELQHQGCTSVAEMDVTKAFHIPGKTVFEITQAGGGNSDDAPPLNFCFFQQGKAQCQYDAAQDWGWPNQYSDLSLVYPQRGAYYPLLLAHLSWCCGFGCGGLFNYVWAYDPAGGTFKLIWNRPYDCHTALRFETKGPLAGDMIAVDDDVTNRFPWPYGIEVYKFTPPDQLTKILYLVGKAGQGGKYVTGPNDAIDTDMPAILRQLSVAK